MLSHRVLTIILLIIICSFPNEVTKVHGVDLAGPGLEWGEVNGCSVGIKGKGMPENQMMF